jgi:uncharacterized protein YbbK (DUF523 family)
MKPRVGISRCLLGDEVRYDGTHKRNADLLRLLDGEVEWVPVCPEVEVGMGTPREPIQLVPAADGVRSGNATVRLRGVSSGTDWTLRMHEWARARVDSLRALHLSGFVLKARSPSCGPAVGEHRGLFAQALVEGLPGLAIVDEDELGDPAKRAAFLARLSVDACRLSEANPKAGN